MGRPRTGTGYVTYSTDREHQRVIKSLGIDLDGLVIHHKDGSKRNNNLRNLELLTAREHRKLHAGTSCLPNAFEYIAVTCPNCLQVRKVQFRTTQRKNYTGLCKSCNGVYNGSYGKIGFHKGSEL